MDVSVAKSIEARDFHRHRCSKTTHEHIYSSTWRPASTFTLQWDERKIKHKLHEMSKNPSSSVHLLFPVSFLLQNNNHNRIDYPRSVKFQPISQTLTQLRGGAATKNQGNDGTRKRKIRAYRTTSMRKSKLKKESSPTKKIPTQNNFKRVKVYITCITIVTIWILTATFFYAKINDWPIPQSFFYAVDAGMSIGFCTDVKETTIRSRAFTILHIILGASCVGGALILFVQDLVNDDGAYHSSYYGEYKKLLQQDAFLRADHKQSGCLTYDQFRKLLEDWTMDHPEYFLSNKNPKKRSKNGVESHGKEVLLNDEVFLNICNEFDPKGEGKIRYGEFVVAGNVGLDRLILHHIHVVNSGYYKQHWWVQVFIDFWDTIASFICGEYRIYLVFSAWMLLGILWGHLNQGWDLITSTHFAVSALATGGLTAPDVNEHGILPTGPSLFCGFYCLFGIPLFALTLGHFARILISNHVAAANRTSIMRPLHRAEFEFAKSLCSTDNFVHLSDYVVLQLMRQGKVSMDTVKIIKKQFNSLDRDRKGVLTMDEATQKLDVVYE